MMKSSGMQFGHRIAYASFGALLLAVAFSVIASPTDEPLATLNDGGEEVFWIPKPHLHYHSMVLTVSDPDGFSSQETFLQGDDPFVAIGVDGTYTYELYMVSVGASKSQTANFGNGAQSDATFDHNGRPKQAVQNLFYPYSSKKRGPMQSGYFTVYDGILVDAELPER